MFTSKKLPEGSHRKKNNLPLQPSEGLGHTLHIYEEMYNLTINVLFSICGKDQPSAIKKKINK